MKVSASFLTSKNIPETISKLNDTDVDYIHVDIMDGFYVDRVVGSIDELKTIRARTNAFLHVHLMTESPVVWADDAIAAGADTLSRVKTLRLPDNSPFWQHFTRGLLLCTSLSYTIEAQM